MILLGAFTLLTPFLSSPVEASAYRQGKLYFSARKYTKAVSAFNRAYRANPSNGNPLFYIGYIYEQRQKKHEAIRYYRRAVELKMESKLREKAYWKLVLYYKYYSDWQNLAIYSRKFLRFRPNKKVRGMLDLAQKNMDPATTRANEHTARGERLFKAKRFAEASRSFQEAVRYKPTNRPARWGLAQSLMKIKKYNSALPHLRKLIRWNNKVWHYHYKAGICFYQTGGYEQALYHYNQSYQLNKEKSRAFNYYIYLRKGYVYLQQGNYTRSKDAFTAAKNTRRTSQALGALSLSEYALGNLVVARSVADTTLKLQSTQNEALLVRALTAFHSGQHQASLRYLRPILVELEKEGVEPARLNYRDTLSLFMLGKLAAGNKDWDLVMRTLGGIEEKQLQAPAFLQLAGARQDKERSRLIYDYKFYYGMALLENQKTDSAIVQLASIQESSDASFLLAVAHARNQNTSETRRYLLKATREKPAYWERARRENSLQALANRDQEFAEFIKYSGKVPEKKREEPEIKKDEPEKENPEQKKEKIAGPDDPKNTPDKGKEKELEVTKDRKKPLTGPDSENPATSRPIVKENSPWNKQSEAPR